MSHPSSPNLNSDSNMTTITSAEPLVIINTPIATKLHRSNYLAWKSQIIPALHGHDLYRFLEDTPPSSHLTIAGIQQPNLVFSTWRRQDQLLLTWLRSSLSDTILGQVVSCNTSSELWQLLQQTFSATSRARRAELRRSLQNVTKGGQNCSDYCQQIRSIADELAFIGSPVTDEDLVLHVLGGLGSDYNALVAAANAKDNLSFVELQAMLMSHESLLQTQMGNSNSNSLSSFSPNLTAYFNAPKSGQKNFHPRPYRSGNNQRPRAFRPSGSPLLPTPTSAPRSYTHYSQKPSPTFVPRPASVRPTIPDQTFNPDRNVICQICDKRGHNAKNCWYRMDDTYTVTSSQPSFQAHFTQPSFQPKFQPYYQANCAQPAYSSAGPEWYLDSGAFHHVTNDINNLSSYLPYEGVDALHIGNGSGMKISHIGSSYLTFSNHSLLLHDVLYVPTFTKKIIEPISLTT
jgi:gag-polypeptide of LTR copia-type